MSILTRIIRFLLSHHPSEPYMQRLISERTALIQENTRLKEALDQHTSGDSPLYHSITARCQTLEDHILYLRSTLAAAQAELQNAYAQRVADAQAERERLIEVFTPKVRPSPIPITQQPPNPALSRPATATEALNKFDSQIPDVLAAFQKADDEVWEQHRNSLIEQHKIQHSIHPLSPSDVLT